MPRRWIRYLLPVMVELNCDDDQVTRVVALPSEIHLGRDDLGHLMVYDEEFVRRHDDSQPQVHALYVTEPRWEYPQYPIGSPINWPDYQSWEEGFDPLDDSDDHYYDMNPYDPPQR